MKVVVLSPHPDDLELFVGGTVLKHLARGDEVVEILVTDGQKGCPENFAVSLSGGKPLKDVGKRRRAEAESAARFLNIEIRPLGLMDGELKRDDGQPIVRSVRRESPDLIYAPEPETPYYLHPDHLFVGKLSLSFRPVRLYHSLRPNLRVDIRAFRKEKMRAIMFHRSQWYVWSFLLPLATKGRWRIFSSFESFREVHDRG